MEKQDNPQEHFLYIKHMVCPRCIYVVRTEFENLGLPVQEVRLGWAKLFRPLSLTELTTTKAMLEVHGFELLQDPGAVLVDKLKTLILEMVRYNQEPQHLKSSEFLARATGQDYSKLSNLFSASQHITIEKYIILQRIEYVKELLSYGQLSLSEISCRLGYSDVSHLSRQFKSVAGHTPSQFKKLNCPGRLTLDKVPGSS